MAGCTRYASNSPTPDATQLPTLGIVTPTLLPIEIEQPTRTPFPIILQTPTATENAVQIVTMPVPVDTITTAEAKNPTLGAFLQLTRVQQTLIAGTPNPNLTEASMDATFSLTETPTGLYGQTQSTVVAPTRLPMIVISGKPNPTIAIDQVVRGSSITVSISDLEPNVDIRIRMGSPAYLGGDGPVVQTVTTDSNGAFQGTYQIPQQFTGYGQIEFRIELPNGYPYYFPFYNNNY